jgi:hypothetical protein
LADFINAHLLIGCDDVPGCLTINNQDLLACGGLVQINNFDEFMSFTVVVIKRKYLSGEPVGELAVKMARKASLFLEDYSIPSAKTVLLWAGRHYFRTTLRREVYLACLCCPAVWGWRGITMPGGATALMTSTTLPLYPMWVRSTLNQKTTMKTFLMLLHDGKSGFSSATP